MRHTISYAFEGRKFFPLQKRINLEIGSDSFLSPFDAVIRNLQLNFSELNGNEQRLVVFEYCKK